MAYIGPKVSSILETDINWNNVKNVPASISKVFQSDGSTTEFDLGYEPANVESVRVSVNQMLKVPYTDYNIINNTILKLNYVVPNGLTINAVFTPMLPGHSSGIFSVQDDTSPSLGGDLDLMGNKLTSSGATNVTIQSGTGNYVEIEGFKFPKVDGTAHQVLKTDGAGSLYWGVGPNTFEFPDVNGTIAVTQIPDNIINVDKLAVAEGTSGQALKTDGAGVLYWADVNLGVIDSASQIVDNSIGPEKLTFGNTNFTILTGDGSTATFNLEHAAPSDESVIVIYQGYIQQPGTDYTIDENAGTITFVNPPGSNEKVQLRYLGIVTQTQGIPYYSVGINQLNAPGQAIGKTLQISANNEIEWATPSTSTVTATVTQVNAGSGLTGGPITTTGTLSLDGSTVTTLQKAATAYAWGSHGTQGYINDPTTINLQQLGNVGTPTASDDTKALVWDDTTQTYIYQQIDLSNIFVEQSGKTFTSQDIAIGANLFDTTLTVNIDNNNEGISIVKTDSVGQFFIDGNTLDIIATGMALDSTTNATGNISFQINKDSTTPIEVLKLDGATGKAVFSGPIQLTSGIPASTTDTIYVDQNALWFGARILFDASTVGGISPANIVLKDGTNNMSGQLNFSGAAVLNVQSNNLQFNGVNQGIRHDQAANYNGGSETFHNMIYSAKSTVAGANNTNVPTGAHIFRVGSEDVSLTEDDVLILEHRNIKPGIGGLISLGASDKMWDGIFTEEMAFHNFGSGDGPDDTTYRLYVKQGVLYFGSQIINSSNILSPVTALADVNIPDPAAIQEGQTLTWNDTSNKWENRTNTFTGLSDTPGTLTALKFLQINAGGTGFQEVDIPSGVSGLTTFLEMTDAPNNYTTDGQKFVKVNQAENALEFVTVNIPDALDDVGVDLTTSPGDLTMLVKDGGAYKMAPHSTYIPDSLTDFNDFPSTYVNMENKVMQVSGDATSIIFVDKTTFLDINNLTDVNIPDLSAVQDNFLRIASGEVTAVNFTHKMVKDFPQPGSPLTNHETFKYDSSGATFQYHNFYRNQGVVTTLANSVTSLEPALFSYSVMDTSILTNYQLILPTTNSKVVGDWFRLLIAFDGTNNGVINLNHTQQSGSELLEGSATFAFAYGNTAASYEVKFIYGGQNTGWCPVVNTQ